MKRLVLALCLLASVASAQLTRQNAVTSDVSKIKGNFDGFRWNWLGYNSQSNSFYITNGFTGAWLDLDGTNVGYKMSQNTSTGQVTYVSSTNVTISDSNVTFQIANTNIPPNGRYLFEVYGWTDNTNSSMTLAQGSVNVSQSLYQQDDGTFPWPASQTSLVNYVTIDTFNTHTSLTYTAHGGVVTGATGVGTISAALTNGNLTISSTGGGGTNTLEEVLTAGNIATNDIDLTGNITNVANLTVTNDVRVSNDIYSDDMVVALGRFRTTASGYQVYEAYPSATGGQLFLRLRSDGSPRTHFDAGGLNYFLDAVSVGTNATTAIFSVSDSGADVLAVYPTAITSSVTFASENYAATQNAYVIPYALTVTVQRANGYYQSLLCTNDTTIKIEAAGTNELSSINLSLWAGEHSVDFNGDHVTYDPVITPATNATTTILYFSEYWSTNWTGEEF